MIFTAGSHLPDATVSDHILDDWTTTGFSGNYTIFMNQTMVSVLVAVYLLGSDLVSLAELRRKFKKNLNNSTENICRVRNGLAFYVMSPTDLYATVIISVYDVTFISDV